jgi:peptidyl-prolyl cis-trans isomerase C
MARMGGPEFDIVRHMLTNRFAASLLMFTVLGAAGCRHSPSGPTVATVGTDSITRADFETRLQSAPMEYQQYAASPEGRKRFLNLLIREKVLVNEAKHSDVASDPAYKQAVDQYHRQMAQRQDDYENSLLVNAYLNKLRTKELAVNDAEVKQYFDTHQAEYGKPVEIQVSHILVATEPEAQAALERLKAGDSFETVARQMSKDPGTARNGGKLPPVQHGTLVPEFENAAFALKNGEISGPVKTTFGFHIIKKTGERVLPPQSYDVVKEKIRSSLEKEKFDHWMSEKQASANVHVDDAELAAASAAHPQERHSL